MPRNVKESDDEVETKGARRTRAALNSSALDSPLRRSTRIKPPTNQENSSPESVNDVTSVNAPKNTRRRTTTGENGFLEAARITRGRRNSTASDISELTETESLPDGPSKRITRRSVAGTSLAETSAILNSRTRRATRAGSEAKSTPPVGRSVRRTRASSMEPETMEETKNRQVGTPIKSRKRASVMPSEPAVAEESEDGRSAGIAKNMEKTVYERNEDESETSSHNTSASPRKKPEVDGNDSDEKMEVDESPVKGTTSDNIDSAEEPIDTSGVSSKLEDSMKITDSDNGNVAPDKQSELEKSSSFSKGASHTTETTVNNLVEKPSKSPGNKKNEVFNSDVPINRGDKLADNEAQLFHKKTFKSTLAKIAGKRRSDSSDDNFTESKITTKNEDIAGADSSRRASETLVRKGHLVDECVVVIEPMDISQVDKVLVAQTSVVPKPKSEDDELQELTSNLASAEQQKRNEAPKEENRENKEDATNVEDTMDGINDLKIPNVSVTLQDESKKNYDQSVDEAGTETTKTKKPNETIDLESRITEEKETCEKLSTIAANSIDSESSIIHENPKTSDATEEIIVFDVVKGKSSIVTESPASGTNAEEAAGSIEEQNNDNSLPNGGSPESISEKFVEDVDSKKINVAEDKVAESDDDSEYSGYPAFKDIPADEWLGGDAEAAKKQNSDETNSVHSASTERNESECEIELVDKEVLPTGEKYEYKAEEKFDYDTDDTVITQVCPTMRKTEEKRDVEETVDEVTPMDVSSDPDEDGDVASKSSKESSKKHSILATPRKSIGANTPTKTNNDSIACVMDVESTISEGPTKDDANVSVKSNRSSSKSPKKRSSLPVGRARNDDSSDSDEETENSGVNTSRTDPTTNRKSLDASAKKLNLSRNTPWKIENDSSGSPAKQRSSNKFKRIHNVDNSDDELDDTEDKNESQSSVESGSKQLGIDDAEIFANAASKRTSMKQGKSRSSGIKVNDDNSRSTLNEDTQSSPLIVEEQEEKSVKIGSARKSISNRSPSKITDSNSNSEIDDEDSLGKTGKPSTPERSRTNKNDSQATQDSLNSDIDGDNALDDPASPEIGEVNLNRSAKLGSARKSAIHEENLNESAKQRSARKSAIRDENLNGSTKQGSAKKSATHEDSPKRSSKQGSARKSAIHRNNSKLASESSDPEAELDDSKKSPKGSKNVSRILKSSLVDTESEVEDVDDHSKVGKSMVVSARKSLNDVDENCSTIDQVNSYSQVMESLSSIIPQFFFDQESTSSSNNSSSSNNNSSNISSSSLTRKRYSSASKSSSSNSSIVKDDSSDTIDSDVARDLNLHGKSVLEYSDDDVPADDCMATESESSDSDDDGADLLDFVVDDDEEEDDEEDDDEEEDDEKDDDEEDDSFEEKSRASVEFDMDVSATAKTPKKPDLVDDDLRRSSKATGKKNKNNLIQSSTPRAPIGERLSFDKADFPKVATPLSKSPKNANSSTKDESSKTPLAKKLSESVCETEESPSKLGSSCKAAKAPTPRNKSVKNADYSTKLETSQISSAKRLSKSVCETEDTPTKLGSSFKVAKSPKTASPQLQTSLPMDFTVSVAETSLSKTKATKLSVLHQTMTTPNTDSLETRFLMKEKLNDTLPALKLQQRSKASRRSTLENLREIPSTDEQFEEAPEENGSVDSVERDTEIDTKKKKRRKKKKTARNTSLDVDSKNLGTSMEIEDMSIDNETYESPIVDIPRDRSKKRDKKKKNIAETITEEPVESKIEHLPTKDKKKKKKKLEENMEEIEVSEGVEREQKKRKKLDETVDEVESMETSRKDKKKKKKRAEIVDEIETVETSRKDKKKNKREETVDEAESIETTKKDKKKKKKRLESFDVTEEPMKNNKNRKHGTTVEVAEEPMSMKKSVRDAEKNNSDILPEAVQDSKLKRQQRKNQNHLASLKLVETSKTSLKRLPEEVLESLTDRAERPTKRRKISKAEKIVPSKTMFDDNHRSETIKIDDGFIPLSASGGTTQFAIVNLQKATRKSKKTVAASSFRERMLARNSRQPISAYLMYQQKQKASGKDRSY